jgi:16S rRNA (guanine527-N7)-methyltransferase
MPLKLMCPSWELTVVESVAKKAAFLDRLHVELKVTGVSIANTRAEDLARDPDHRERMDVATARAVASLASLIELCAPLVRSGGLLLFPKSGTVEAEVDAAQEAARRLGARLASVVPIPDALGLGSGRSIVVYERHGSVPPGYPRRTGLAQSRPIGT